mmetsp:Transcript_119492/g.194369  ORF Transcript_119492/g.194369 Transcript_119492/m.194369 type:complete len:95 (-) Transcript_119492:280-564(-)
MLPKGGDVVVRVVVVVVVLVDVVVVVDVVDVVVVPHTWQLAGASADQYMLSPFGHTHVVMSPRVPSCRIPASLGTVRFLCSAPATNSPGLPKLQ